MMAQSVVLVVVRGDHNYGYSHADYDRDDTKC